MAEVVAWSAGNSVSNTRSGLEGEQSVSPFEPAKKQMKSKRPYLGVPVTAIEIVTSATVVDAVLSEGRKGRGSVQKNVSKEKIG